jgi:hypothetical protein
VSITYYFFQLSTYKSLRSLHTKNWPKWLPHTADIDDFVFKMNQTTENLVARANSFLKRQAILPRKLFCFYLFPNTLISTFNGVLVSSLLLKFCSVALISPHVSKMPKCLIQFSSIFFVFNLVSVKNHDQISILKTLVFKYY